MDLPGVESAFARFDSQDSGCLSYGVEADGARWFVKVAVEDSAAPSLERAVALHTAVNHPVIVQLVGTIREKGDIQGVVYPWVDGTVLSHATAKGSDRSGLERFQQLPLAEIEIALSGILDAHLAIVSAGFVAVDLYDGCFLYDFAASTMWLIDLDEYRPGAFILDGDRLPGSKRYMAPEEWVRGSIIDERTTVFNLGRALYHLLDSPHGWRGRESQRDVINRATAPDPDERYRDVPSLAHAWQAG